MSTTTNIQNLLVNVFRPVYTYDPASTTQLFKPKLELSNVDTYIGNSIYVLRAQVGDSASNVYVGIGSGNDPTVSVRSCRNVTAVGYNSASGISNVSNSVFLGFNAGANQTSASSNIVIGSTPITGSSSSNIIIGCSAGSIGSNNILIGHATAPGNVNNTLRISNLVYGDFTNTWLGIGTSSPLYPTNKFDLSGTAYISGKMGIQMQPSNSLNVNGETQSTGGFFSTTGVTYLEAGQVSNIAILQQGTMLVQVQDESTPGSNYHSRYMYVSDVTGSTAPALMQETSNGYIDIQYSTSNIQISNSDTGSHTFKWSTTSFPLNP